VVIYTKTHPRGVREIPELREPEERGGKGWGAKVESVGKTRETNIKILKNNGSSVLQGAGRMVDPGGGEGECKV